MNPDPKDKSTVVTASQKKLQSDFGVAEITVPRDRQGEFEPQMVKKGQSRLSGLDEKIMALYARGMSVRDIKAQGTGQLNRDRHIYVFFIAMEWPFQKPSHIS